MSSKSKPGSSRVNREDAGRAVDALLGFLRARAKQQKAQLFEHDDFIYLHISTRRLRSTSRLKPYLIPLPHTLHPLDPSRTSLCLIADDSFADAARSTAADENLPFDSVIPISQLRTDYVPFEARRRLCDSYDIFFAERRIVPLLSRLIGNCFFKKNKVPLAINISRSGWPEAVREACRSTLLHLSSGTCSGLKVGRVSMDREQIIDNLMATINAAVGHIPKKWANIRCMYIMSVQSVALPIYQAVPEIGMRIDVVPREKAEPLNGVVDHETVVQREVDEKNKKKSGLSKKRKMRIHDVDFSGTDPHDRSVVGDGDGEEEQTNDELGLKKKVKKKHFQGKPRRCKKGKSAGNEEDECEEKENDGEFIELVTERKKTKRAKKIKSTGVDDYAIEKVEPLDGVVDQESDFQREVEETNKNKSGLSKKRKIKIRDVDFTGSGIHDRSEVGDGDGEEEQTNDKLGLKKKVKKKHVQGEPRKCKKEKSAGNKEGECKEKENDGEFIELVTEKKKMKRAKKIASTGVEDYAIKIVSDDGHGDGKKKKMNNGVKRANML